MNLVRKQLFKNGLLFKNMNCFSYSKDIMVNLRGGKTSLDIEIPNQGKTVFFIDNNFTFNHLKSLINMEYPNSDVDVDFQGSSKARRGQYDENSLVQKFIDDQQPGVVHVKIDENEYNLRNVGSFSLNKEVEKQWE